MGKMVSSTNIRSTLDYTSDFLLEGVIPKPRAFSSGARDLARIYCEVGLVDFPPMLRQVMPVRIHCLNQPDFLASSPAFNFPLAADCSVRICKPLVVNQPSQVVTTGEALDDFVLVFPGTANEIAGDACVQHVRTLAIRHDIDMELFGLSHGFFLTTSRRPKSVMDAHWTPPREIPRPAGENAGLRDDAFL